MFHHAPRVARRRGWAWQGKAWLFHSRAPWGATLMHLETNKIADVSIPRPAWGATARPRSTSARAKFNSRARVGATICFAPLRFRNCFIHAPRVGATEGGAVRELRSKFQPRARVGRDSPIRRPNHYCVSVHAPRVGRHTGHNRREWRVVSIHAPRVGRDGT